MREDFMYPQPTPEERDEANDRMLPFNPFWRGIVQTTLDEMKDPELWPDYEEVIEAIENLMVSYPLQTPLIGAKVYRNANMNAAINTNVQVTFEEVEYDTAEMFDTGNPARLTAPINGYYQAIASVSFAVNATGRRRIRVLNSGATVIGDGQVIPTASGNMVFQVVVNCFLSAADWIEITAFQDAVNPLAVVAGISQTWLSLACIGT